MAIPEFTDQGYLPRGLHPCSLEEIQERFGSFLWTNRRAVLNRKFLEFVHEIRATDLVAWLVIDGSFATDKPEPNDMDLILVLHAGHDFSAELRPFEYNVVSRRCVQRRYEFDVLVARENSPELAEYIEFFEQVRGESQLRKGLLKVVT